MSFFPALRPIIGWGWIVGGTLGVLLAFVMLAMHFVFGAPIYEDNKPMSDAAVLESMGAVAAIFGAAAVAGRFLVRYARNNKIEARPRKFGS